MEAGLLSTILGVAMVRAEPAGPDLELQKVISLP